MAEVKPDLLTFSAAATGITLTIGKRLSRNFSYYRKQAGQVEIVRRDELLLRFMELTEFSYSLHNLMMDENEIYSPFLVAIAGQIVDTLDDIHRKLLIYDADKIVDIIPLLDSLREKWNDYTEPDFYDQELNRHIESDFPFLIKKIEAGVRLLPYNAKL